MCALRIIGTRREHASLRAAHRVTRILPYLLESGPWCSSIVTRSSLPVAVIFIHADSIGKCLVAVPSISNGEISPYRTKPNDFLRLGDKGSSQDAITVHWFRRKISLLSPIASRVVKRNVLTTPRRGVPANTYHSRDSKVGQKSESQSIKLQLQAVRVWARSKPMKGARYLTL
ncbi:hypothetical protein BDZ97DRAFT_1006 [Flammula alnicola]|nr:hypothetical protein BDZ97DRAFT_1006 [Flammula alnicola]